MTGAGTDHVNGALQRGGGPHSRYPGVAQRVTLVGPIWSSRIQSPRTSLTHHRGPRELKSSLGDSGQQDRHRFILDSIKNSCPQVESVL
jgi:hypothetical protein